MENNNEIRPSINILLNEDDIRREIDASTEAPMAVIKGSSRVITASVIMLAAVAAVFAVMAFVPSLKSTANIIYAVIFAVLSVIMLLLLIRRNARRKKTKQKIFETEMGRRKSGFKARRITFEEKGIRTSGEYSDFVIPYESIGDCHEFADGIFMNREGGMRIWLPARFFTKELAEEITAAMQYVFGKKYSVHAKLEAPDEVQQVVCEQLAEPKGSLLHSVEYTTKKSHYCQRMINNTIKQNVLRFVACAAIIVYAAAIAAEFIKMLMMPFFSMSKFDEWLSVLAALIGAIAFFAPAVYDAICVYAVMPMQTAKASYNWTKGGVKLDLYDDVIVEQTANGKTVTPWDNVETVFYTAGDMMIVNKYGGAMLIPEKVAAGENGAIEAVMKRKLNGGEEHEHGHCHEHGEGCSCGHDHSHEAKNSDSK